MSNTLSNTISSTTTNDLNAINSIAARAGIHWSGSTFDAQKEPFLAQNQPNKPALRFLTCGSVDDGKSTLMGRLLIDTRAVTSDQLASVQRSGATDLALLTDGLQAEREQGITIDVAYRYFSTATRKFIMADAPGHAQYTRNMVTAASSADAAVVLVDATKLNWQTADTEGALLALLPQTRRHTLLAHWLRVPSVVFVVNKLDAVADAQTAFVRIRAALLAFAVEAGIPVAATVPISALLGWNVTQPHTGWCGYHGPALLAIMESLPTESASSRHQVGDLPFALPVQWVEKLAESTQAVALPTKIFPAETPQGRRIFWGRIASGSVTPGQSVQIMPSGEVAVVAQLLSHTRQARPLLAGGESCGIVLDREVDVSRGDWLQAAQPLQTAPDPAQRLTATVAWLDEEPLRVGRTYWALHGHRWVKAKIERINHQLNIETLAQQPATELPVNALGEIVLQLREPLAGVLPYEMSRSQGSLVLVDTASHKTSGALMVTG